MIFATTTPKSRQLSGHAKKCQKQPSYRLFVIFSKRLVLTARCYCYTLGKHFLDLEVPIKLPNTLHTIHTSENYSEILKCTPQRGLKKSRQLTGPQIKGHNCSLTLISQNLSVFIKTLHTFHRHDFVHT